MNRKHAKRIRAAIVRANTHWAIAEAVDKAGGSNAALFLEFIEHDFDIDPLRTRLERKAYRRRSDHLYYRYWAREMEQ